MSDERGRFRTVLPPLTACAGAVLVSVWGTWPLAAHLHTHIYELAGMFAWRARCDTYLTTWILAWDVHALTTSPTHLFDANIFYPARLSLATTEHMLGVLPVYFPLAVLSRDPVFAHQATLLLTFAAAFLAMVALVRSWTASWPAAILAGVLFAFSPLRASHLSALNLEGNYYLPLIPLCAERTVSQPGWRWPVLLGVVLTVQGLCSYYVAYFAFLTIALLCATLWLTSAAARRRWRLLLFPVLSAGVVVALSALPYLVMQRAGAISPPSIDSLRTVFRTASAEPGDFGIVSLALPLAAAALVYWRYGLRTQVDPAWIAALFVVAVVAHLLALGPEITVLGHSVPGPYTLGARFVPGFGAVRVPLRFNAPVTMAIAALAGIAVAGARRHAQTWLPRRARIVNALSGALVIGCAAWSVHRFVDGQPLTLRPIETRATLPPVYRWLATAPPGAVLEFPFRNYEDFGLDREVEGLRQYRSLYHWHPLVNGESSYSAPTYRLLAAMAARLPDPAAIQDMARLAGVRYVVLHSEGLTPAQLDAWATSGLPVHQFDSDTVYLLPAEATTEPPPLSRPLSEWGGRTPNGAPLQPLGWDGQRAHLSDPQFPSVVPNGLPNIGSILVENRSERMWPGIVPPGAPGVRLVVRIRNSAQDIVWRNDAAPIPLAADLAPGQTVRSPIWFSPPISPGEYTLEIALVQEGIGSFDPSLGGHYRLPLKVVPYSP
ncbi:MAG: hypothetical protein ACHQ9S_02680 [Candidatus Binatia bacterium]